MQDTNHSPLSLIEVQGEDRAVFLQGQFSNDMAKLTDSEWCWTALCNPKGRAIATFMTWSSKDTVYLLGLSDICQDITQHLQKFIFRSKVKLSIKTPSITISEQLSKEAAPNSISTNTDTIGLAIAPNLVWKIYLHGDNANNGEPLTSALLAKECVEHMLPLIGKELSEELIPNHFDFTALNGINFQKGCYTGQEVIARLHYLGKLKQALFNLSSSAEINIKDKVFAPKTRGNQPVGDILWSYQDKESQQNFALACMKIENMNDPLAIGSPEDVTEDISVDRCFPE